MERNFSKRWLLPKCHDLCVIVSKVIVEKDFFLLSVGDRWLIKPRLSKVELGLSVLARSFEPKLGGQVVKITFKDKTC